MKTNRQIADECAQAVWSWLCERYDIPLPTIQQVIQDLSSNGQQIEMPGYRVSMTQKKTSTVSGISNAQPNEVIIAGKSLSWLPKCRLNNAIESWTLQFVGEFTRAIELRRQGELGTEYDDLTLKATLNQIEFAKLFFPHLYRKHREALTQIMKRLHSAQRRHDRQKPNSSEILATQSTIH